MQNITTIRVSSTEGWGQARLSLNRGVWGTHSTTGSKCWLDTDVWFLFSFHANRFVKNNMEQSQLSFQSLRPKGQILKFRVLTWLSASLLATKSMQEFTFYNTVFSSSLRDIAPLTFTLWNLPWTVLTFLPRFGRHYRTGLNVGIKVAHCFWVNLPYKRRAESRHKGLSQPQLPSVKPFSSHSLWASSLTVVTQTMMAASFNVPHRDPAKTGAESTRGKRVYVLHEEQNNDKSPTCLWFIMQGQAQHI